MRSFLSLTRPHSRICIRIYIFVLKKHTHTDKQKAKETKEEKRKTKETKETPKLCLSMEIMLSHLK